MKTVDYHLVVRAMTGSAMESGDTGVVVCGGTECFVALVDALGHGPRAHDVAVLAQDYLQAHSGPALDLVMRGLHESLRGTDGAVVALCRLRLDTGEMTYLGVGNITVKVVGLRPHAFTPRDGIVGYLLPGLHEQRHALHGGDVLVLHSDGIRQTVAPEEYRDLLHGTAAVIAQGMLERFGRATDDASCLALRLS